MAKIKNRLLDYLKINNITKQDFCDFTGISYANITGKSIKSELGGEQISIILMKFPQISPDWLILGIGEMFRKSPVGNLAVASAPHSNAANGDMKVEAPAELVSLISSQQETINRLSKTIEHLVNHN